MSIPTDCVAMHREADQSDAIVELSDVAKFEAAGYIQAHVLVARAEKAAAEAAEKAKAEADDAEKDDAAGV